MKNFSYVFLLLLFVIFLDSCKQVEGLQASKYNNFFPKNLSIEYIRYPQHIIIIDNQPEFAWEVPNAAISQSAYQILVVSSKENMESNTVDVWDSGKVLSNQSINVEYKGKSLKVGNTYFWKVKIWNEEGKESAFSKAQRFTIGAKKNIITLSLIHI